MERRSFSGDYVKTELEKVALKTLGQVAVFVIGGLALINYGLKSATKDIDVVVKSQTELDLLTQALIESGYHLMDDYTISRAYQKMETAKILENQEGFRWDIFLTQICGALRFTDTMEKRTIKMHKQGGLEVKIVAKEDIFLFKGITEREADLDDMRLLAESMIDWQIVKQECQTQSELSGRFWENALHCSLVSLRKNYKIHSPIEKTLERKVEEKLSEDRLKKAIQDGELTIQETAQAAGIPENWVREYAKKMEAKGLLKINKTKKPHKLSLIKKDKTD